jgi:hypothetical protein
MAVVVNIAGKVDFRDIEKAQRELDKFARSAQTNGEKATRGLGGVKEAAGSAKTGTIALGTAMGGLLAQGVGMAVGAFGDLVNAARAGEAADRITAQVIKTTGGAAHITAQQVGDLATAISNKTGVDDDAIKSAENMLLTFTDVRNEVGKGNDIFNQATSMVTDMSVALGEDGKSAAIQLGKALNDPIKGVTALQKVGVSFTEAQKKQIAVLVQHGDKLGAQKLILHELGREFGGAAAAASDPMQKLSTTVSNLAKGLAADFLPAIEGVANFLLQYAVPAIQTVVAWLGQNFGPVLNVVAGFIRGTIVPAIQSLAQQFMNNIWPAIKTVAGYIASNLQPVIQALGDFWRDTLVPNIQKLVPVLGRVAQVVGIVVGALAIAISFIVGKVAPVFFKILGGAITFIVTVLGWVGDKVGWVIDHFGDLIGFVQKIPGRIGDALKTVANVMTAPFRIAFNAIATLWNNGPGSWSFSVPSWVPKFGGDSWSMPKMPYIPALAAGGVVTRPTLALIGEAGAEAVVPLTGGSNYGVGNTTIAPVFHIDARGATSDAAPAIEAAVNRATDALVTKLVRELRSR